MAIPELISSEKVSQFYFTIFIGVNIFVDFPEYMKFNEFLFDFSGDPAAVPQLPKWWLMLILMIGTVLQPCPARNRKSIATRECAN